MLHLNLGSMRWQTPDDVLDPVTHVDLFCLTSLGPVI